ncbi:acid phosphatase type 7-like [Gigantopelta aegis]|uniref:acid phosphatase type 7-like n=1 Tax=Gigantopelta aegis TaxID=1735272 RepID=UPI001B88A41A|nr:acid phosphatase type 7-like [Gigantopelta aegis]
MFSLNDECFNERKCLCGNRRVFKDGQSTSCRFATRMMKSRGYSLQVLILIMVFSLTLGNTHETRGHCLPEQVHLAFGNSVTEVVIVWATRGVCSDTNIRYGTLSWALNDIAVGRTIKFTEGNSGGLQNLHRVELKNLHTATTYFYEPQSNNVSSGPFYFQTPAAITDWSPLFLILGDLDADSSSIPPLTSEVMSGQYSAVIHVGDVVYNETGDEGKTEDLFMKLTEVMASHAPYMVTPGRYGKGSSFEQYRHRYSMPGSSWPIPKDKVWYSVDVGPVHLISYSTEVFFTSDQTNVRSQRDWLMADLKQANDKRDQQPWVVAIGHRPMYCSNNSRTNSDCAKDDSKVRQGFEDLFFDYGVDVVLQSHDVYERMWPLYKGVVLSKNYTNPTAPIQLVVGAADVHSDDGHDDNVNQSNDTESEQPWSAFNPNISVSSHGHLHVINSSHAYWEVKSTHGGDLLDSVWIVQKKHGPFKTESLPKNVSNEIKESLKKTGGKPSYLDNSPTAPKKSAIFGNDRTRHIAIGIASGTFVLVIIATVVAIRKCRKPRQGARRWEQLDFNYGKKLYAPSKDMDKELDNDFEIDMNDGTTKLLS